jgi:2-(1,2-epoxy-1,2-dihydrophenyl)acetyl-CoA isomerase
LNEADAPVLLAVEAGVATVTLNRPHVLNALDAAMAQAFADAVGRIAADGSVRALLLRGAGRSFCAGGDVARFVEGDVEAAIAAIIDSLHAGLRTLDRLSIPSVVAVQGAAAGAGFSLAMACDLCIAADDAVFNMAYPKIGASPDGSATYRLPRLVGARKALELALLSETVPAAEAQSLGLVNRLVPAASLGDEAYALARKLADGPTQAYGRIKSLLAASLSSDLSQQLDAERAAFLDGSRTADFMEGAAAFLAKRRPRFEGR